MILEEKHVIDVQFLHQEKSFQDHYSLFRTTENGGWKARYGTEVRNGGWKRGGLGALAAHDREDFFLGEGSVSYRCTDPSRSWERWLYRSIAVAVSGGLR